MEEKKLKYFRNYYHNNKEKFNKGNEKVMCSECGSVFKLKCRWNHLKSSKHLNSKQLINPIDGIPIYNMSYKIEK